MEQGPYKEIAGYSGSYHADGVFADDNGSLLYFLTRDELREWLVARTRGERKKILKAINEKRNNDE